ncbi:hypothetical protein BDF19DRAFT_425159 [Syncephalis fuscata]|nr:hypothetical protein BDF19DRAFT_425159 [Syncephalis fuscata]
MPKKSPIPAKITTGYGKPSSTSSGSNNDSKKKKSTTTTTTQQQSTSKAKIPSRHKTSDERFALLGKKMPKELGRDPPQAILDMLRVALNDTFGATDFETRLQQIKAHFYVRDYNAVFSEPTHLPVYAARYVPGRSLCYYQMFTQHPALLALLARRTRIYALGAGAGSELAAIMAAIVHVKNANSDGRIPLTSSIPSSTTVADEQPVIVADEQQVTLHMQDIADWQDVIKRIEATARDKWNIPAERFKCEFSQGSVLNLVGHGTEALAPLADDDTASGVQTKDKANTLTSAEAEAEADKEAICAEIERADLVTAMFVMNELFTDKRQAMQLVKALVARLRPGAHLLLVDSAGSFSNLKVGQHTYMIYTIFDALHAYFEPIVSEDSEWYRYPKHLHYPLELNNMRYFIRLYRRL